MGRHSSIERLPDDVLERLNFMFREGGFTLDDLKGWLDERGHDVSRSALGRHKMKLDKVGEHLRRSREMAEALAGQVGPAIEDGQQSKLLIEILQTISFEVMTNQLGESGEDGEGGGFDPQSLMFLGRMIKDLVSSQKIEAERVSKIKAEAKKEAAEAVDEAAQAEGLDKETIAKIRKHVLGAA